MSIKVTLPTAFTRHTAGKKQFDSIAENLPALLADIDQTFPALGIQIKGDDGKLLVLQQQFEVRQREPLVYGRLNDLVPEEPRNVDRRDRAQTRREQEGHLVSEPIDENSSDCRARQ